MPLVIQDQPLTAHQILYVVGTYPSPTETFIDREIQGLRHMGLDVRVLPLDQTPCFRGLAQALLHLPRNAALLRSLRADPCPLPHRRCLGATLRAATSARACKDVSHIHAHFLGLPATVAFCLSRMIGIPYSLTAHARDIYAEHTPQVVIRDAAFRTTCTQTNADFLKERYPDAPFELIRHGLDPVPYADAHPTRTAAPCRLLTVGRLVDKKGLPFLLRACAILRDDGFPFTCTIIGEGPLHEALSSEIAALGLSDRISLLPFLPHEEVIEHYHAADLLVVPSITAKDGDRDGVPNVILEAMASGLPAVAADAGSIPEAVTEGTTGILVPPKDPTALANAIFSLWHDPARRTQLATQATDFVRTEFAPDKWLARLHTRLIQPNCLRDE